MIKTMKKTLCGLLITIMLSSCGKKEQIVQSKAQSANLKLQNAIVLNDNTTGSDNVPVGTNMLDDRGIYLQNLTEEERRYRNRICYYYLASMVGIAVACTVLYYFGDKLLELILKPKSGTSSGSGDEFDALEAVEIPKIKVPKVEVPKIEVPEVKEVRE